MKMTVEELLESILERYKRKHKRLTYIGNRTRNKRIKRKVDFNNAVALKMIDTLIEIIHNRRI